MGLEIVLTAKGVEGILVPDYPEMLFTAVVEHAHRNAPSFPLLSQVDLTKTTLFDESKRADLLKEWERAQALIQTPDDGKKWSMVLQWLSDRDQFALLEFVGD